MQSRNEARPLARIYFTDFFDVSPEVLAEYGAFNVSPIVDLPLFIDPFLLFTSEKPEYQSLHEDIIRYLRFLRDKSLSGEVTDALLKAWYCFHEVRQNCLGFCLKGNRGSGLGMGFAQALNANLQLLFSDFGSERVTKGSHLEKLVLVRERVGRDNISDFTTNLIKGYLLRYTQAFAQKFVDASKRKVIYVERVEFDYDLGIWKSGRFDLPWLANDFVLLTPEDILTKDDIWINKEDLRQDFDAIREAIDNDSLRGQIDHYFRGCLKRNPTAKEEREAAEKTLLKFPALIDYYIKNKEENGDAAVERSAAKVSEVATRFVQDLGYLAGLVAHHTDFYKLNDSTVEETRRKIQWLKHVIENQDGYRLFYDSKGTPMEREKDLQIAFKLVWEGSPSSADAEVNNGRGPVDFKISRGSKDSTLVEFKLASNSSLERNLENQVKVYEAANRTIQSFKVIVYFTLQEAAKVGRILRRLGIQGDPGIILLDARRDNKPSASNA